MLGQQDNINLKVYEKKSVFLRLYGIAFFIILLVIIIAGYFYLNSIEYFAQSKINGYIGTKKDTAQVVGDLPMVKGTVSPPVDVTKFGTTSPELIARGKELYTTNCAGCHGNDGKGDGIAGAAMNPKPRNFHDANGWKNGRKLQDLYKTLQEGLPNTGMPAFTNISPEDRFAIIHFIRSLTTDYPPVTNDELAQLDKIYSLSSGVKMPNQIPVKLAIEKIIQESGTNDSSVNNIIYNIEQDTSSAASIFKISVYDIKKAVLTLNSNRRWIDNQNDFVNIITTGTEHNGFRTSVLQLNAESLNSLYSYLKDLFSKNFNTIQKQS